MKTPSRSKPVPAGRPYREAWSLTVLTSAEAEDAVGELLFRLTGEPAVASHSRATGLSAVAVYLSRRASWSPRLRTALRSELEHTATCGLDIRPARISFRRVPPTDWRESWKKHFQPLAIGRQLLVRPSWSRRRPVSGQAELVLDPGLSFGTGQHPTTKFCLREVVRLRPRTPEHPAALLDVGTGSGILALAAARLGYQPVIAFDFDPESVAIAHENATGNELTDRLEIRCRDVAKLPPRPRRTFDVVCANLTADLLLRHAPTLAAHVRPGGHLVLAGILATEFDAVQARFEAEDIRLHVVRHAVRREWKSAAFLKAR